MTSKACCTIPPVVSEGYEQQGSYKPFGSMEKAYIVGPESSDKAIVVCYDVFGYYPQTIQGADILAATCNATVVMPDVTHGKPVDLKDFPPDTPEKQKIFSDFFATTGSFPGRLEEIYGCVETLRAQGAKKVGVLGYCWGGKVVILAGQSGKVDAAAAVHPAMMAANDADDLKVPIGIFISNDEDVQEAEKFIGKLEIKPFASQNVYEHYPTMHHGWAAARGDLSNPENLKCYKDVYQKVGDFFNATLA